MSKFIGCTIGLEANRGGFVGKMVKVDYTRLNKNQVRLDAVSGRNLEKMQGFKVISQDDFSSRPTDPYDSVAEAKWALNLCGWNLMTEDEMTS